MKKLLLPITLTCLLTTCFGQQFSFQMYFTDAVGNKDTIILGYDLTATDSIDTAFVEINILSVPLDTNLDVRITNFWINDQSQITFQTKKQIVFYDCTHTNVSIQPINIFTQHWPVTATWNNTLFNDSCRNGSLFTSINPGGWWDTGSPSDLWRKEFLHSDSATFTSNYSFGSYGYNNSNGDSIPVFWQAFGDSTLTWIYVDELIHSHQKLNASPNPTNSLLNLKIPDDFGNVVSADLYSMIGNRILTTKTFPTLDLTSFENGTYFIVVTNEKGEKLKTIAIKM